MSPQQLPSQRLPGIVGVLLEELPTGVDEDAIANILQRDGSAKDKAKQICAVAGVKRVPPSFAALIETNLD